MTWVSEWFAHEVVHVNLHQYTFHVGYRLNPCFVATLLSDHFGSALCLMNYYASVPNHCCLYHHFPFIIWSFVFAIDVF